MNIPDDSQASTPVAALRGVAKRYGNRMVVAGADLAVNEREILGLVGPNGAGKTTLLKIIAGLVRPTKGTGNVLGCEIGPHHQPSPFVGIMAEKPAFMEHASARRNLLLLASIRHVASRKDVDAALETVGLDRRNRRPVRSYSQGMRQRLALAQAIMERPRLLLLDEPTNGLDPVGIVDVRETIRSIADAGTAVVLCSHLLAEVQAVCHTVLLIDGHRVVPLLGQNHASEAPPLVFVEFSNPANLARMKDITEITIAASASPCSALVRWERPVPDLVRSLVAAGLDVERIGVSSETLEARYLSELTTSVS